MLAAVIKQHFAQGSTLARDRIGLGQSMPEGYALMQTAQSELYWVNEAGESSHPIETNDARLIRRMANNHKSEKVYGMERPQ